MGTEVSQKEVEAAAKTWESVSLCRPAWDEANDAQRDWIMRVFRRGIEAAAKVRGEKVVYVNEAMSQLGLRIAGFEYGHIFPGEELVIRKAAQ